MNDLRKNQPPTLFEAIDDHLGVKEMARVLKDPQLATVRPASEVVATTFCAKHEGRHAPYFCERCGSAACEECTVESHMGSVTCTNCSVPQLSDQELNSPEWRQVHSGVRLYARSMWFERFGLWLIWPLVAISPYLGLLGALAILGLAVAKVLGLKRSQSVPAESGAKKDAALAFTLHIVESVVPLAGACLLIGLLVAGVFSWSMSIGILLFCLALPALFAPLSRIFYIRFVRKTAEHINDFAALDVLQAARKARITSVILFGVVALLSLAVGALAFGSSDGLKWLVEFRFPVMLGGFVLYLAAAFLHGHAERQLIRGVGLLGDTLDMALSVAVGQPVADQQSYSLHDPERESTTFCESCGEAVSDERSIATSMGTVVCPKCDLSGAAAQKVAAPARLAWIVFASFVALAATSVALPLLAKGISSTLQIALLALMGALELAFIVTMGLQYAVSRKASDLWPLAVGIGLMTLAVAGIAVSVVYSDFQVVPSINGLWGKFVAISPVAGGAFLFEGLALIFFAIFLKKAATLSDDFPAANLAHSAILFGAIVSVFLLFLTVPAIFKALRPQEVSFSVEKPSKLPGYLLLGAQVLLLGAWVTLGRALKRRSDHLESLTDGHTARISGPTA